ncbi:uncharacterized protein ATNIH1004_004326 [Aspergillus tanneri]|uniref:Nucleoside phosphorylase domain-containing protein n=1 Tax=Aspergillus tanneri TaxID=1220188 RepID=A0A5M9MN29_9EURO|nr:uncharacterized protein ATNIH1004_004326 [Aspergillus tanneri]KAA8648441.1 hypothetical protein ATNIH1004_004326 [Aspergillus tanneri]
MLVAKPFSHAYTVGWICALSLELAAAKAILDEVHEDLPLPLNVNNNYTLGAISDTVIACLPMGIYSRTSATTVTASINCTFPNIRFFLLVGIGGGVPSL